MQIRTLLMVLCSVSACGASSRDISDIDAAPDEASNSSALSIENFECPSIVDPCCPTCPTCPVCSPPPPSQTIYISAADFQDAGASSGTGTAVLTAVGDVWTVTGFRAIRADLRLPVGSRITDLTMSMKWTGVTVASAARVHLWGRSFGEGGAAFMGFITTGSPPISSGLWGVSLPSIMIATSTPLSTSPYTIQPNAIYSISIDNAGAYTAEVDGVKVTYLAP